ncbi:MAG: response regulator [Gloeobacterales cyanobacterium]
MQKEKILLIEGHDFYRTRFMQGLISQNYEVVCYRSAENFDHLVQQEAPYLVIADVTQLGLSEGNIEGKNCPVLEHCQAFYPWLPIVLMVERSEPIDPLERRWAVEQGAADFIVKRVDRMELLLQRIHDLLRPGTKINQRALLAAYAQPTSY